MTPFQLLKDLREGLRKYLDGFYKLPAQYQDDKKVSIYIQNLPQNEHDTIYPLVLIELLGSEDDADSSTAEILITVGTFGWDCTDFFNLNEAVREFLTKRKIVGNAALRLPISFGIAEKEAVDFDFGNFFVTYEIMGIK